MGDRCYMKLTCRLQDVPRFEPLGFDPEDDTPTDGRTIELCDPEANYAHSGDLPTDIPWTAYHYEGGDYGSFELVCCGDGKIHEWATGHGNDDYVFPDPIAHPDHFLSRIVDFHAFHHARQKVSELLTAP
jgi:hypothetical protein